MAIPLKGLLFLIYCIHKVTPTPYVQGQDIRITCSVPGTWPSWTKDGIIISLGGSADIYTGFPRITYAADQRTLQLSKLTSEDAGNYTCSFPGGGSGTFTVIVDVVSISDYGCPSEDSGFAFITSACATENAVQNECKYIFIDHNNQQKEVCKYEKTSNSTGCSVGKSQETAGFQYTKSDSTGKLRVNIICNLLHSSSGDTVHDSHNCTQDYYIDPCCQGLETACYVLFPIAVSFLIIDVIICVYVNYSIISNICNECTMKENYPLIIQLAGMIFIILCSVIWFGIVAGKVVTILPDGELDDCCDCTHLIVFVAFMAIFICLGIGFGLLKIYWDRKDKSRQKKFTDISMSER